MARRRRDLPSDPPLPAGEGRGEGRLPAVAYARQLRHRQTDAESLLWRRLRRRELAGFKFRRQHPVGEFIVDFFCEEARLTIEIDGGGHARDSQIAYDLRRTKQLEELGLKVLRFWNTDVLQNLDGVVARILEAVRPPSP